MDRHPEHREPTTRPTLGEPRAFQSADELIDPTVHDEARLYENGKPPVVGDGSAVERRDFIKVLGATFAAATTTAACGRLPVTKALPYADKPEDVIVGRGVMYATTCRGCSAGCGVLVKSREGRPIKVEGNPGHKWSQGGACAIGQAQVVDLYDGDRLRQPMVDGKPATWKEFDAAAAAALGAYASDGKGLLLVTPTLTGPAARNLVQAFLAHFAGSRHLAYDGPFGAGAITAAHAATHGRSVVPRYDFSKAAYVLSFGADFLGTWIAPVPFAKQWNPGRKVSADKTTMSKLVAVESRLSLTGSNADARVRILPSEQRGLVLALAAKVATAKGLAVQGPAAEVKGDLGKHLDGWVKELLAAEGQCLVVADSADIAVQAAVNVINEALGNYGKTLDVDAPFQGMRGSAAAEAEVVEALAKGELTGAVLWGVNPAYDSRHAAKWAEGLKKAKVSIAIAGRAHETAAVCKLVGASHHPLESWGDHEVIAGLAAVQQPLVNPLFDTRQGEDLLLGWTGAVDSDGKPQTILPYLRLQWHAHVGPRATGSADFDRLWDSALNDGFVELQLVGDAAPLPAPGPAPAPAAVAPGGPMVAQAPQPSDEAAAADRADKPVEAAADASPVAAPAEVSPAALPADASAVGLPAAATPVVATFTLPPVVPARFDAAGATTALGAAPPTIAQAGALEVVLYPKVGLGAGDNANNPMLQELPDPISKATWGNYACLSPKAAKALGLLSSDVVVVSGGTAQVELPVVLSPGQHDGVVALPIGYGRATSVGRLGGGVGKNVMPFAALADIAKADVKPTGAKDPIAFSQTHHSYEHRDCVKETTLAAWQQDPTAGNAALDSMLHDPNAQDARTTRTLWTRHQYPGYKWGMAIDLNSCTGCGACVVACNIENNVPVVGKHEVLVRREMHWMRIDRYFSERKTFVQGDYDWQPTKDDLLDLADNPEVVHMPMLCQHCDNAPCETVCPVLATMHTSEGLNAQAYNRCIGTRYCANNCPYKVRRFNWFNYPTREMVDKFDIDLVTLALNPDIVKRSRGVMEKCSFCVQRIQEAKSNALRDADRATGEKRQPSNLDELQKNEAAGGKPLQPKYVRDGEVKPACQQTCPSDAITFGDLNLMDSKVRKAYEDPRNYSSLVEVGTQPAVTYMTKVRHAAEVFGPAQPAPKKPAAHAAPSAPVAPTGGTAPAGH
ncbi:MAG: 4Fe-4S dicluster domain-containing protein [Deltaproteobacteria bacterium]|nr:4Fe-4S dicluster domain-containing protein [Deltaproteobacteria bacterium]